jgi:hypothetical protein
VGVVAADGLFVICVAETGQSAVGGEPALSGRVRPTTDRAWRAAHFTKYPASRTSVQTMIAKVLFFRKTLCTYVM